MVRFFTLIIFALACVACEGTRPYYEAGLGYQLESGDYVDLVGAPDDRSKHLVTVDERCFSGGLALGLEFDYGVELEVSHRSCINSSPEINRNEVMLQKRGYFGGGN